jgi:large subunit ribosomal protein L3
MELSYSGLTTGNKIIQGVPFALLGKKIGMTQVFSEEGDVTPVTVLEVGPCAVTQVKTREKDGYTAVQLGFADKKKQRVNKPEAGHAAKAKTAAKRFVREVRVGEKELAEYEIGMTLTADLFKAGDRVDVAGVSIGKGYAGVMKRWNFRGARHSHNHEFFRHGGSIGNRSDPGKVFKNKKMPGQLGNEAVTVQNLKVVAVEADKNIILVKGAVPGHKNGYVVVKASVKGGFEARSPKAAPAAEKTEG